MCHQNDWWGGKRGWGSWRGWFSFTFIVIHWKVLFIVTLWDTKSCSFSKIEINLFDRNFRRMHCSSWWVNSTYFGIQNNKKSLAFKFKGSWTKKCRRSTSFVIIITTFCIEWKQIRQGKKKVAVVIHLFSSWWFVISINRQSVCVEKKYDMHNKKKNCFVRENVFTRRMLAHSKSNWAFLSSSKNALLRSYALWNCRHEPLWVECPYIKVS